MSTLLALITIVLWSFLAVLNARLTHLPPIFTVGIALTLGGLPALFQPKAWKIPLKTLATGIGGIFGYHFIFFTSFHYAPAVEVNLINYLWPLLIVILTPVYLPPARLKLYHIGGAVAGLSGAALIVTAGQFNLNLGHLAGYALAATAAIIWASYSLLTKRLPPFPTATVGVFCLVSGVFSLLAFALGYDIKSTLSNVTGTDWLTLLLMGAGPLGAAFFTWDAALKRGDPRIIGALSYLTPLFSTLNLVWLGGRSLTWATTIALPLIIGGAILGALELFTPKKTGKSPIAAPDSENN